MKRKGAERFRDYIFKPNVCRKDEALPLLWRMPIVYRVAPNGYITVARPVGKRFAVMLGL